VRSVGKGVKGAWNAAKSAIGLGSGGVVRKLAHGGAIAAAGGVLVPGLAGGGNNLGRDTVPAMLSPGEWVLPNSVTQNGNLMADIAGMISGKGPNNSGSTLLQNVATENNITNEYNISVNVSGNARMTKQEVEREILPVILDGIKDATQRGKQVVNKKGVF
jgi:hypothetical protein